MISHYIHKKKYFIENDIMSINPLKDALHNNIDQKKEEIKTNCESITNPKQKIQCEINAKNAILNQIKIKIGICNNDPSCLKTINSQINKLQNEINTLKTKSYETPAIDRGTK